LHHSTKLLNGAMYFFVYVITTLFYEVIKETINKRVSSNDKDSLLIRIKEIDNLLV